MTEPTTSSATNGAPAPLSARVSPAEGAVTAATVTGVTWRPARPDDLDAVVELYAAMSEVDHPLWTETRDEVELELADSHVDLALDTLIGEIDGRVIAFGQTIAPPDPETVVRVILVGGVHPAHRGRGIGRALLAWQDGRARQQLAASGSSLPGWIMSYSFDSDDSTKRLLEHEDYPIARYFSELERRLDAPIPVLELPTPLRLSVYSDELSEATRVAKNEAFRDHWGSQPTSQEHWEGMRAVPQQRPDLSYLALDGDEVVGFVLLESNEADWERQGYRGAYVSLVGVVAEWRRRGVAPALLAAVLHAGRDAGLERTVLDVDSESPTGALGLYTGMGFESLSQSHAHVKEF